MSFPPRTPNKSSYVDDIRTSPNSIVKSVEVFEITNNPLNYSELEKNPYLIKLENDILEMQICVKEMKQIQMLNERAKKFDGSWVRVGVIMLMTYVALSFYMYIVLGQESSSFWNAIVPTVGFNLSTWSLPPVKRLWMKWYDTHPTKIDDFLQANKLEKPLCKIASLKSVSHTTRLGKWLKSNRSPDEVVLKDEPVYV